MFAEYHQCTGRFRIYDGATMLYECFGYAGKGDGVNNPAAEAVAGVGPLPRATWRIQAPYTHPRLGALSYPLALHRGQAFGRSAFFIHGDNKRRNQSASSGCIVLDRRHRERLAYYLSQQGPRGMLLFVHTDDEELERIEGLEIAPVTPPEAYIFRHSAEG